MIIYNGNRMAVKVIGVNGSGVITEVSTATEMATILTNATREDVGRIYQYLGESAGDYEKGAYYVLKSDGIIGSNGCIFEKIGNNRSIVSIGKTASNGLIDTYTIYYTDNTTSIFEVTNGKQGVGIKGITSGKPTQSNGYTATPITVTKTDNTTEQFSVFAKNGTGGINEDEVLEPTSAEYFTFTLLDDDTYEIKAKDINNMSPVIVIPSTYEGKAVTSIGEKAFDGCTNLTSVVIGKGVTSIGDYAFRWCSNLASVVIPNSVTSIGAYAFSGCSSLTSVVIPDSVTSIGDYAFYYCSSLTSIEIPNSVTSIGAEAFYSCGSLTSVVIGKGVTSITERMFQFCSSLVLIEIPNSVTEIGEKAFSGCGLRSIEIPNSVTSIGSSAFWGCNCLHSVVIPNSITSIGESAFSRCSSLTSIEIPNSVTSIGDCAFYECENLASIEIPNSVTSIGDAMFWRCSDLTSIVIPNSVTSIGENAFQSCESLTSVVIPDSVTSIGTRAFSGCSSLTSVVIPDSVTSIGNYAFDNCSGLTSVVIGKGVTSIGDYAFYYCSSLTIYCKAESQPEGWSANWNYNNRPVVWEHQTTVSEVTSTVTKIINGEKKIKQLRIGDEETGEEAASIEYEVNAETGEKTAKIKGEVIYIESTFNGEQGTKNAAVALMSGCVNIAADEQINFTAREGATTFFNGNVSFHNAKVKGLPSSGTAIIDVAILPTENVNENVIYRVPNAMFYHVVQGKLPTDQFLCNVVDTLPEVGNPAVVFDASYNPIFIEGYYVARENKAYGYVDNMLSQIGASLGQTIPVGWYPLEVLFPIINQAYGGVINSTTQATDISSIYLLVEYGLFIYKNGRYSQPSVDTNADFTWNGTHTFNQSVSFGKEAFFNGTVDFSNADVTGLPTSVGKTKITLAELRALLADYTNNRGKIVQLVYKGTYSAYPYSFIINHLSLNQIGYSDIKNSYSVSEMTDSAISIIRLDLYISSSNAYITYNQSDYDFTQPNIGTVSTIQITDDNFDFYIIG